MISRSLVALMARIAAVIGWCLAVGCTIPAYNDPARLGPFFVPTNHSGVANLPAGLHRVMLLPLSAGEVTTPEMAVAFDPVFATALQKENRFEVVTLSRDECRRRFGVEELSSSASLPRDFMTVLHRDYAVDAVLFMDLTALNPYRPLAIGVRAKLATVDGVRLLWNFDTVFSAADAGVANSARRYLLKGDRGGVPGDLSPSVLQSPARFCEYVATAMFATLPPVYSAPPPPKIESVPR